MNTAQPTRKLRRNILVSITSIAVIALAGVFLYDLFQTATHRARRNQCPNNLKQIVLALHAYHDTYDCLPPAYLADEQGRPMHSWRVLILPFMDSQNAQAIYDAYHFDEPWDGPRNKFLPEPRDESYKEPITFFKCWTNHKGHAGATNYMVVTGPGTAFPGDNQVRWSDLGELRKFPLVVEVTNSDIHWSAPVDLPIDQMSFQINDPHELCLGSRHLGNQLHIAFADGAIHTIVHPSSGMDEFPFATDEKSLKSRFQSVPPREEAKAD